MIEPSQEDLVESILDEIDIIHLDEDLFKEFVKEGIAPTTILRAIRRFYIELPDIEPMAQANAYYYTLLRIFLNLYPSKEYPELWV